MKRIELRKEKGITLLAFVITIILLIILAVVTIDLTIGDRVIFNQAMKAGKRTEIGAIKEKLELAKLDLHAANQRKEVGLEEYIDYIDKIGIIDKETDVIKTEGENSALITIEGEHVFYIEEDEKGDIQITYQGEKGEINPIIDKIEVIQKDTSSIEIEVKTKLTKEPTYIYYIAKEDEEYGEKLESKKENRYKFERLTQGTTYKIKVVVQEKKSGITEGEIKETVGEVIELDNTNTEIKIIPNDWTKGNVTVSITTNKTGGSTGLTLQYKTSKTGQTGEEANWTNYTEDITLTRNQTIYARAVDRTGQSATGYASYAIEKIDKVAPEMGEPTVSATTNSITVTASATDSSTTDYGTSGLAGYRFKIDSGTWSEYQTSGTYTFTGLTQNTSYTVYVEAKDNVGNTVSKSSSKTIGKVEELNNTNTTISLSPNDWTNGNVTVSITTNKTGGSTGLTLQYKTSKTGQTGEQANWTNYTGNITLTRNQTIYARAVDSTGQAATGYASSAIGKIDKVAPTMNTPTVSSATTTITMSASATDSSTADYGASGIGGYRFKIDSGGWSGYQTSGTYTFTGLQPNTSHTVYVEAKDNVGYTVSKSSTFSTKQQLVTGVTVSPSTSSVLVGKTVQLSVSVSPSNATNKGVTWSSNNTGIAQVSTSGLVTGKGAGTATITATATDGSGKKGTCTVKVGLNITLVQGNFVNYSAGTWTQADINKLGSLYAGQALPTSSTPYKFGGFKVGSSKDSSISVGGLGCWYSGWRVLSNSNGKCNLVHAGISEAYFHPSGTNSGYKSEYILNKNTTNSSITEAIKIQVSKTRDWSMYENNLAVPSSARCLWEGVVTGDNQFSSLFEIREEYYFSNSSSGEPSNLNATMIYGQHSSWCDRVGGIRPVVTLKSSVVVVGGSGTSSDPYKLQ